MKVEHILRTKESRVVAVRTSATVAEAVKLMKAENISALIVKDVCRTEGNTLAGVLSERDVVHALLERGGSLLSMPVSQLMTRQPVTCTPSDSVQQALQLMDKHHIRHLPVLEDGHLVGVVSARDFTRLHLQELEGTVASVAEPPPATTGYAH
jgi:CBS domain-containing protein|nr:CBS domain-containing protein [uncultured Azospirillum sp.]